ncbi:MAG: hypothetical protein O2968_10410 [Acidobacteria bacterium]|nr:hypothetical protein [Acidobacteriota bacterium]
MKTTYLLAIALALAAAGCQAVSSLTDECKFRAPRSVTLDAARIRSIKVHTWSGQLTIQGRDDITEVRVTGEACSFKEDLLEGINLRAEPSGSEIEISAIAPQGRPWSEVGTLDLKIEAPASLRFDVTDGSGSLDIANVSGLLIDDGSGSLEIIHIAGDVEVKDGAGSLKVEEVRGHVNIKDGGGSISVSDIGGNVTISDGRGSISVKNIAGDFTVSSDSRGSISHSGVAGRVSIPGNR